MRSFEDIFVDYTKWLVKKTGNPLYAYKTLLENEDPNTVKSFLYKSILELCYDKKDGMYYFCKFVIGDLLDIGFPKPFRYNKLLREWDKLVKKSKKLCILCARGHGKSVYYSEVLSLYDMFLFKHRRLIMISASQEQANRILQEMKDIIEHNEWLVKKKNLNKWAAEMIYYNDGYILVKGIGSEILGQHVDRIIVDDILRSDNKISDTEIEDYIDMTLSPMLLNRNGQMIIVGTPKSGTDIFTTIDNRIREGSVWTLKRYPAIIDYEKKILQCPDRFTWDDIIEKRLEMGPLKFAREYQLEVFSRDVSLFPDEILEQATKKGKEMRLLFKGDKRPPNWIVVFGIDVARSGSASADYTWAIGLAYNSITQEKQIIHIWKCKGLKISRQAEEIARISKNFEHPFLLVEQNNMGQDMIDELIDKYNVNVEPITTGAHTVGKSIKKEELIRFLISAFEQEKIIIPRGDNHSRELTNELIKELKQFCAIPTPAGNELFQGIGSHDDGVIALALANRATQIVGIPFAVSLGPGGKHESGGVYSALLQSTKGESDIEKMIKLGIIK